MFRSEYGNHIVEFLRGKRLNHVRPVELLLHRVEEARPIHVRFGHEPATPLQELSQQFRFSII